MSASDTNTSSPPIPETVPETKQRAVAVPVHTTNISWGWLVGGLLGIFVLCGGAGLVYMLQSHAMAGNVLEVADEMIKRADDLMAEAARIEDRDERNRLLISSLDERRQAMNLLNNFRRMNPDNRSNDAILRRLYDVLEVLYEAHGGRATMMGNQFGNQLISIAAELVPLVTHEESLTYRARLLQLEWEQFNLPGIISRGIDLHNASVRAGNPENYDARRFIAMALYDHLPVAPYNPQAHSLPPAIFPPAMDELLRSLNAERPHDIEIARRYADFIISVAHPAVERDNAERQRIIIASASDHLRDVMTQSDRATEATRVIDRMVELNPDDPDALIVRYYFEMQFLPPRTAIAQQHPDLTAVLRINPDHIEGLVLSSRHALRLMEAAGRAGDTDEALRWRNVAREHLEHAVASNPGERIGYQFLGDFFLFIMGDTEEAIRVWRNGIRNVGHLGNEELIGRLSLLLLERGMVQEVNEMIGLLNQTINNMLLTRPRDVERTTDMRDLLLAKLANTEARIAATRREAARRENNMTEMRRQASIEQSKRGEAMQRFERVLGNWGVTRDDYVIFTGTRTVYNLLLPESLLALGVLKMEFGQWDQATTFLTRALDIPSLPVQIRALERLAVAFQQSGNLARAAAAARELSNLQPNNLPLRYSATTLAFRAQTDPRNTPNPAVLNEIERELDYLGQHRSQLTHPWALDIRRIHLDVFRANLTNDADTILAAMNDATRRFRALERGTFPPDEDGNVRGYIEDPAFVSELLGIYSSMASRPDFDNLLNVLRAFPGGEDAYFEARINDAIRRGHREEALVIIDEAFSSNLLSEAGRENFAALLQNLRGETADAGMTLERFYAQLRTAFDESPETLRPPMFLALAEMALDTDDLELARRVMDRLRQIEGTEGTTWQFINVRLMLKEPSPNFEMMRQIQERIAGARPTWDAAYILRALIEERYLEDYPDDLGAAAMLITSYRNATLNGNRNPEIWERLVRRLELAERTNEARDIIREAHLLGITLHAPTGQFPPPYGRMYADLNVALQHEDATEADRIARSIIQLAEMRVEREQLIFALHLTIGRVFLDAGMFDSAIRHLSVTAQSGGTHIYPLAVAVARSGDIDGGFTLLLDEIDLVPSLMQSLLPAILVLLAQVQPSEAIYERIDRLMDRIERGERLTLRDELPQSDRDHFIGIGTRHVPFRRIQSFVVRFPGSTGVIDPSALWFFAPEDLVEEGEEGEEDEAE